MVNDLNPFHTPGDAITCGVTAAVTGKRLVKVAGAADANDLRINVRPCGAGERAFGVAARDKATDDPHGVLVWRPDAGIYPVTAGDAITANTPLASDADGKVVPAVAGDVVVAWALDDCAEDEDAMVELIKAGESTDSAVVGGQANIAPVATADAADLATAIALANANKAKINTIIATLDAAGITD